MNHLLPGLKINKIAKLPVSYSCIFGIIYIVENYASHQLTEGRK